MPKEQEKTFTKQELYCLARQTKFFYHYYWVGKKETEEPCYRCPLQLACDFSFVEVFQKLGRMAGEEISLMVKPNKNDYKHNLTKEAASGGSQPLTENELRYLRNFAENEVIAAFVNHKPAEQQ